MKNYNLALPFYRHLMDNPSRPALTVDGISYSYGDLGTLAGRIATHFIENSPRNIERVGILSSRSLTAFAGILASCWAGVTFVPLNPKYPEERILSIVKNSKLDALILDNSGIKVLTPKILSCGPQFLISPCGDCQKLGDAQIIGQTRLEKQSPIIPPVQVDGERIAYILFTSGTTGEPKGVMVTNANLCHFLDVSQDRYLLTPNDHLSQQSEITFDHIAFDLFMAWRAGASVHVVPEHMAMAPAEFIKKKELTVWFSVPSVIAFLKEMRLLKPGIFPSLRISLFAGEPLSKELADAWREAAPNSIIHNLYGPTEATVDCLWQPFAPPFAITPNRGVIAIGRPYPGMRAAIVDSSNNFLCQGEIGELAVSGPQVSAGYWNNPNLTTKRYPRLFHKEWGETTWYLTGDLSYEDESGIFHYLGRIDNQVKVLGQRVELEDVEFHLREVCKSDSVAVVAWPMNHGSAQGLIAFVTDKSLDLKNVKGLLRSRIQSYMVPRRIVCLERLPLNLNGKVDRKALVKLLEETSSLHA